MGNRRCYQIFHPFFIIFLQEYILENLPSSIIILFFFFNKIAFFFPFILQHDLSRKCTHNHHRLAVKRQLSPLTVAEIAPGYVWALYPIQWLGLSAGGDGRK